MNNVFKEHPNLKECYQTSDGQCFYTPNAAENHAKTLTDKNITHLKNSDSESEDIDPLKVELSKIKKLKKDDLIAYATENEIELGDADTVKDILVIVNEAVTAKFEKEEE